VAFPIWFENDRGLEPNVPMKNDPVSSDVIWSKNGSDEIWSKNDRDLEKSSPAARHKMTVKFPTT
jgi:hypothetical protein